MFSNKNVLITGGNSGIGKSTALKLASLNANLFLVARRENLLEETCNQVRKSGKICNYLSIDLRKKDSAYEVLKCFKNDYGHIDVLINNAGTFPNTPFEKISDDEWENAIDINLSTHMRITRELMPLFSKDSSIVNISSINAVYGDKDSVCSSYSAAKAGLLGLTRQLAVELAPKIRVNAIVPGAVETPMIDGWLENKNERQEWLKRFVPMKRIAQPDEIADAIIFLSSNNSKYITGTTLYVDGGYSVV